MILVLSGEGPTDLGVCRNGMGRCDDDELRVGPLTVLLDKLIVDRLGYSLRDYPGSIHYISKASLVELAEQRKSNKRLMSLTGKKHGKETGFYLSNAWVFGMAAKEIESERNETALAVIFRDSDPMRSDRANIWREKAASMEEGFRRAEFKRGVAMLAMPKSEAWLLCAAKERPFQHCAALERLSGNDDSPNAVKDQLTLALGGEKSAEELAEWLDGIAFDVAGASDMPSFLTFYERLTEVLDTILG